MDLWGFPWLRGQGAALTSVYPCRPGPCWTRVHQSQLGGAPGPWRCSLRRSHPHRHWQWVGGTFLGWGINIGQELRGWPQLCGPGQIPSPFQLLLYSEVFPNILQVSTSSVIFWLLRWVVQFLTSTMQISYLWIKVSLWFNTNPCAAVVLGWALRPGWLRGSHAVFSGWMCLAPGDGGILLLWKIHRPLGGWAQPTWPVKNENSSL